MLDKYPFQYRYIYLVGAWLLGFWVFPEVVSHSLFLLLGAGCLIWHAPSHFKSLIIVPPPAFFMALAGTLWVAYRTTNPLEGIALALVLLLLLAFGRVSHQRLDYFFPLFKGLCILSGLLCLAALAVFYSQAPLAGLTNRFSLPFVHWGFGGLHAIRTGILCGLFLLITTFLQASNHGQKVKLHPLLSSLIIFILSFAIFATRSRGACLSLLIGLSLLFFVFKTIPWKTLLLSLGVYCLLFNLSTPPLNKGQGFIERGNNGRFAVYTTYTNELHGMDYLIGKGKLHTLPASQMGWFVHHPHSAYIALFWQAGTIGVLILAAILISVLLESIKQRKRPLTPLFLAWLGFGWSAFLFEGTSPFSLYSGTWSEPLYFWLPALALAGSSTLATPKV